MGMKVFGFGEFRSKLEKINRELPHELDVFLKELAMDLLARTKEKTPVGVYPPSSGRVGGTLRRGWQISDLKRVGSNVQIEVSNPVEYGIHVEYGHRTRGGGGFVEGRYMLTVSLKELERAMPARVHDLWRRLGL
ncbi:HK97 gp10 family phage protein [Bacillus sp. AFS017336]|uniref:HK97 gp10 family phage protein n=1 Tax=Bacillus sp. AFS017336 TaxID=2033489 RepID=UPI000BF08D8E|nr:HK97 gp10 family phage protein [Bacillus sp. AFS017336]PEL12670.1 hypothetical protein CN601_06905 [Bacillus sp. AFS017336]